MTTIEDCERYNAELRTALGIAIRTMDCLIGDLSAHKDCAECQENVASYEMALAECRAVLGETDE